jgi:hypothetical protein
MTFSKRKGGCLLLVTILFLISTPTLLKADFRYGVYFFNQLYGGIDFSEDKEVYSGDPNCDMDWGQVEIPNIHGFLIDLGVYNFIHLIEAPDEVYPECQINMELNHVYVLKTKENCYVKILIISEYTHAMLWVYQDDGSRNLDWRGTTTDINQEIINILSNPTEPILMQNYPNPFNSSTIIEYSVLKQSIVTISIYDIQGRKVKQLLNEFKNAGSYKELINLSDLPSGNYFYRLKIGENIQTKSMVLSK